MFGGVVHVLRTGCAWKAVGPEAGSGSTLHRYFRSWEREGVFHRIWREGLAEHVDLEGIAWRWQPACGPSGRTWSPAVETRRRGGPAA